MYTKDTSSLCMTVVLSNQTHVGFWSFRRGAEEPSLSYIM